MTTKQTQQNQIESWLDERQVNYEFHPTFSLHNIDQDASIKNQARFAPLIADVWVRYKEQMKKGANFPAIVGVWLSNGKVKVIDGNHRVKGYREAKVNTFPAYILPVDTNEIIVQILTYEANARLNGVPPSEDERLQHALHLVASGASQTQAAMVTGLTNRQISRAIVNDKADRRVAELGINKFWTKLSPDVRMKANLIRSDPPFVAAVRLISEGALTGVESKDLLLGLQNMRSDQEMMDYIKIQNEILRSAIQERGAGILKKGVKSPRHIIAMHVQAILNQSPEEVKQTCLTEEQKVATQEKVVECMTHLEKIFDLLSEKNA